MAPNLVPNRVLIALRSLMDPAGLHCPLFSLYFDHPSSHQNVPLISPCCILGLLCPEVQHSSISLPQTGAKGSKTTRPSLLQQQPFFWNQFFFSLLVAVKKKNRQKQLKNKGLLVAVQRSDCHGGEVEVAELGTDGHSPLTTRQLRRVARESELPFSLNTIQGSIQEMAPLQ